MLPDGSVAGSLGAASSQAARPPEDYAVASSAPDQILLPLLTADAGAPFANAPPLHVLPGGRLSDRRLAFRTGASSSATTTDWIATTHAFPAAYPRSHDAATAPPGARFRRPRPLPAAALASPAAEKAADGQRRKEDAAFWKEGMSVVDRPAEFFAPRSRAEALAEAKARHARKDPQLWGVAQRIVPVKHHADGAQSEDAAQKAEPVTLLLMHATGFHKEIYEPFVRELGELLASPQFAGVDVEEVWSLDTIISGESAVLNQQSFGEAVAWADSARDLIQFVTSYMPPLAPTGSRSTRAEASAQHLWPAPLLSRNYHAHGDPSASTTSPSLRASPATSAHASKPVTRRRRIVALGHSYAGAAVALAANAYPEMFERIILTDPILIDPAWMRDAHKAEAESGGATAQNPLSLRKEQPLASGAVVRKDVWRDAEAAATNFSAKPFFKAWDKDALALHLKFGIVPLSAFSAAGLDAGSDPAPADALGRMVTLAMPKVLEASSFSASWQSAYAHASILSGAFRRHNLLDKRRGRTYFLIMEKGNRSLNLEKFDDNMEQSDGRDRKGRSPMLRGAVHIVPGGHLVAQEQPRVLAEKVLECILEGDGASAGDKSWRVLPRPRI